MFEKTKIGVELECGKVNAAATDRGGVLALQPGQELGQTLLVLLDSGRIKMDHHFFNVRVEFLLIRGVGHGSEGN